MVVETKLLFQKEIELVNGLKLTANWAYHTLYKDYSTALGNIISRIIKNREEAEDVLQDTFILISQKISLYDPEKSRLYTWMAKIARNRSFDYLRSAARRNKDNTTDLECVMDTSPYLHINSFSIEGIGLKKICNDVLTPSQKDVINLLYYGDYTHTEAADVLKVPLGTLKTRNRLALVSLKKEFGEFKMPQY